MTLTDVLIGSENNKSFEGNKKIIFDITFLLQFIKQRPQYSGIQRVVTKLITSIYRVSDGDTRNRMHFCFRESKNGTYFIGSLEEIVNFIDDPARLLSLGFDQGKVINPGRMLDPYLKKYKKNIVKYYYHYFLIKMYIKLDNNKRLKKYGLSESVYRKLQIERNKNKVSEKSIVNPMEGIISPGDTLVSLDSNWAFPTEKYNDFNRMGVRIVTMIYDLIPILKPWACPMPLACAFSNWLFSTINYTNYYITISESAKSDLDSYLGKHGSSVPSFALPLVQSFDTETVDQSRLFEDKNIDPIHYPDYVQCLGATERVQVKLLRPYVLCVGTIEIRKNPLRLAQAWRLMATNYGYDIPKLIFAGHLGWGIDDFKDFIENSGNVFGLIEIIENPSDSELKFLYKNCLFATMPSLYEGWGLPVGEALSFGKTVVVSNNSSLPEVGGTLVEYCDATSVVSIADAMWRLISNPNLRRALENEIKSSSLRNWEDVARDFKKLLQFPFDSSASLNTGSPHPPSPHKPS